MTFLPVMVQNGVGLSMLSTKSSELQKSSSLSVNAIRTNTKFTLTVMVGKMINTVGNLNLQQERTRSILNCHYVTYIPTHYNYSYETQYDSVYISLLPMHVSTDRYTTRTDGQWGWPPWLGYRVRRLSCNIWPISNLA